MRDTITIRTMLGSCEVEADVLDPFAVHKAIDMGAWMVTHVASGNGIVRTPTKAEACKVARLLRKVPIDWGRDIDALAADPAVATAVRQAIEDAEARLVIALR